MKNNFPFKTVVSGVFLAFSLLLGGCHDTQVYYTYPSATLAIQNDDAAIGDIWYAYVTPSDATTWGDDLLGNDILQPGDELLLDVASCDRYYDIRIEYDNAGPVIEQYNVWLPCGVTTTVTYNDW